MSNILPLNLLVPGATLRRPENEPHGSAMVPTDDIDLHAEFVSMREAFAHHGGMPCADEVVSSMRGRVVQPISVLARRIVSREVIAIEWQRNILVPMFQFDEDSMNPSPACREIVAHLSGVMDDWTIAHWFASRNPLLGGESPVDMLSLRRSKVVLAASMARQVRAPRGGCSPRP